MRYTPKGENLLFEIHVLSTKSLLPLKREAEKKVVEFFSLIIYPFILTAAVLTILEILILTPAVLTIWKSHLNIYCFNYLEIFILTPTVLTILEILILTPTVSTTLEILILTATVLTIFQNQFVPSFPISSLILSIHCFDIFLRIHREIRCTVFIQL